MWRIYAVLACWLLAFALVYNADVRLHEQQACARANNAAYFART